MNDRRLNGNQHRALDRLAKKDEGAVVVGWSERMHSPLVVLSDGRERLVNTTGWLIKVGTTS
jgi:hypothetical protein